MNSDERLDVFAKIFHVGVQPHTCAGRQMRCSARRLDAEAKFVRSALRHAGERFI